MNLVKKVSFSKHMVYLTVVLVACLCFAFYRVDASTAERPISESGYEIYHESEDGIQYTANMDSKNTPYFVAGYVGNRSEVTIPDFIGEHEVRRIKKGAFQGNKDIIRVNLSDSIHTIETNAFKDCTQLSEVKFGDRQSFDISQGKTANDPIFIENKAFEGCSSLLAVDFPHGALGEAGAFQGSAIQTVTLNYTWWTNNTGRLFDDAEALETINISDDYDNPHHMSQVILSDFKNLASLKTVNIYNAEHVEINTSYYHTSTGEFREVFVNCPKLQDVNMYYTEKNAKGLYTYGNHSAPFCGGIGEGKEYDEKSYSMTSSDPEVVKITNTNGRSNHLVNIHAGKAELFLPTIPFHINVIVGDGLKKYIGKDLETAKPLEFNKATTDNIMHKEMEEAEHWYRFTTGDTEIQDYIFSVDTELTDSKVSFYLYDSNNKETRISTGNGMEGLKLELLPDTTYYMKVSSYYNIDVIPYSFSVKESQKIEEAPSETPSVAPSETPSVVPSETPSVVPSETPSVAPSETPSVAPSETPSVTPSELPSVAPSELPSVIPSELPSQAPSTEPTDAPDDKPGQKPEQKPTEQNGAYLAYRIDVIDSQHSGRDKLVLDVNATVDGRVYAYANSIGDPALTKDFLKESGTATQITKGKKEAVYCNIAFTSAYKIGNEYNVYLCFEDAAGKLYGPYLIKNYRASYMPAGDGTRDNPYQIWNYRHFLNISAFDEDGLYYELMQNIDMSVCPYSLPRYQGYADKFKGHFEGNGHTIIKPAGSLFTNVEEGATICNLYVSGADMEGVGGIIVSGTNKGSIRNCAVADSKITGDEAGAIAVMNASGGEITACKVMNTTIIGTNNTAGGIVARNYGTVSECVADQVDISGLVAGGIVGHSIQGTVTGNWSSLTNVDMSAAKNGEAGGIVGYCNNTYVTENISRYVPQELASIYELQGNYGAIVGAFVSGASVEYVNNNESLITSQPAKPVQEGSTESAYENALKEWEKKLVTWKLHHGDKVTEQDAYQDPISGQIKDTIENSVTNISEHCALSDEYDINKNETEAYNQLRPATEVMLYSDSDKEQKPDPTPAEPTKPTEPDNGAAAPNPPGIKPSKKTNKITVTAKAVIVSYSTKAQTVKLGAKAAGGALTYTASNTKVKVSKDGKVTIPAKFAGRVTLTIQTAGNATYKAVSTKVTISIPKAVALSSVKNAKGKKLAVKWKKTSRVTGYEISYANNRNFKNAKKVTVKGDAKTSATIRKLIGKKTYSVKVRAYITKGKKTYYSAWSSVKSAKITK